MPKTGGDISSPHCLIWTILRYVSCNMYQNNRHYYMHTPYTAYTHIYSYDAYIFDTQVVGPFSFFEDPIADWCERTVKCNYEEQLSGQDNTNRYVICNMYQNNRHYYMHTPYIDIAYTHIYSYDAYIFDT
jgi:hypothetical protein